MIIIKDLARWTGLPLQTIYQMAWKGYLPKSAIEGRYLWMPEEKETLIKAIENRPKPGRRAKPCMPDLDQRDTENTCEQCMNVSGLKRMSGSEEN